MWATGQPLDLVADETEIDRVWSYIGAYSEYVRLRNLDIEIRATDLDPLTVEILYLFRRKIEDVDKAKRESDRARRKR